jgi:NAD(P)-dependent dehydrogenase (short-subunit alcohol dehydrogenase family)
MAELEGTTAAVWGGGEVWAATSDALVGAGVEVLRDPGGRDVDAFLEEAAQSLGRLDLAVICIAGPGAPAPLAETSDDAWDEELDRCLGVAFRGVRRSLKQMLEQRGGRILLTTSVEAKLPRAGAAPYVAAQHGIAGLVKSVAHEVGPRGVFINALLCEPTPAGAEATAAAALTLASPSMRSVTGTLFPVHGGTVPY